MMCLHGLSVAMATLYYRIVLGATKQQDGLRHVQLTEDNTCLACSDV